MQGAVENPLLAPDVTHPAHRVRATQNRYARAGWVALGTVLVAIGAAGVIVPGLPTTIFIILALACYARSSPRLYDRLARNRLLGRHARAFRESGIMPRRAKVFALGTMWPFVTFAVLLAIPTALLWAKAATVALAVVGTAYIVRLPSKPGAR